MRRHELRIGGRAVTLVEGPAGWGECSPLAGYPCDPAMALRSAEEAARDGEPVAPVAFALLAGEGLHGSTPSCRAPPQLHGGV